MIRDLGAVKSACPAYTKSYIEAVKSACTAFLFTYFLFIVTFTFKLNSYDRRFYPQRSSGQAVVTGVVPSPPVRAFIFIAHNRVQHSHCSSIFIECC